MDDAGKAGVANETASNGCGGIGCARHWPVNVEGAKADNAGTSAARGGTNGAELVEPSNCDGHEARALGNTEL